MTRPKQDAQDQERILAFATRWLPYGGGTAEDIMVTFGTTSDIYFRRLQALLEDTERPVDLDRNTTAALLRMCRRRQQPAFAERDRIAAPQ